MAFYVSTGARASELLSATQGGVDPGRQLITVVRKGTRRRQELPASTDAFVWLRLYQLEMEGLIPKGRRQPLWWTLRRPFRPLTYHAAHRMFERVGAGGGQRCDVACAAAHRGLPDGRGSGAAADRCAVRPGSRAAVHHADLPDARARQDVIRRVLAHHAEQTRQAAERAAPPPAPGYRPETLNVLFGTDAHEPPSAWNPPSHRAASGRSGHVRARFHARPHRLAGNSCWTANRLVSSWPARRSCRPSRTAATRRADGVDCCWTGWPTSPADLA